jgi:hypothetical protein
MDQIMKNSPLRIMPMILVIIFSIMMGEIKGQDAATSVPLIDVVWLKDGSRLSGTIIKWELNRGMEFKLLTGATMVIPRPEIRRVFQQIRLGSEESIVSPPDRSPRPYSFKEEGLYHTFSGFLNTSFAGGAGMHYSIGHRFNRLLGAGIGFGYESNDLDLNRNFIPLYAEARGFLLARRITPYYAVKAGYGFAVQNDNVTGETHKGGFHFAPEAGVRFGGQDVNFYAGAQYKIQSATYTSQWGEDFSFTDKITYRRLEMRLGIVF